MKYYIVCKQYMKSIPIQEERYELKMLEREYYEFLKGACSIEILMHKEGEITKGQLSLTFSKNVTVPISISFLVEIGDWKKDYYVFAPAAVYNGNRFVSLKLPYPPFEVRNKTEILSTPTTITDIPHLEHDKAKSKIQLRSGDMSTPATGYYNQNRKEGFLLIGEHIGGKDYTGFTIEENLEERKAFFSLSLPAVREGYKYFFGPNTCTPSDDQGRCFDVGDKVTLHFCMHHFRAPSLADFFHYFNDVRMIYERGKLQHTIPFYKAYKAIKEKYQKYNFTPEGYYSVGTDWNVPQQCWQAGWIGGGMNNYSFLLGDDELAYERGFSTFRFILDKLQNEKGWVTGIYANGIYYGDNFDLEKTTNILLVRKNADLLFFLLKESILLEGKGESIDLYKSKIRSLANAFVRLFDKYGQVGQFMDIQTEELVIGNSASAGILVGALALASEYFKHLPYLEVAQKLADYYYNHYVSVGILNGCPGEICQAPDSEAAFGLLDGYIQLYETTKEEKWLNYAKQTFEIAITWVMSYDFDFPYESTAAKLNLHTLGTVFANVQNKHSAPGICSLSGNSLLKLYRFTKERRYLDWLHFIAHALPQFVSLEERPIFTLAKKYLPSGFINERVQTSDWEGKETIGEFAYGSNWPEVSMLLTFVEIPGIYIDFSQQFVYGFDHIDYEIKYQDTDQVVLELFNNTLYDTKVTLLVDESKDLDMLKYHYYTKMKKVSLYKGEKRIITLTRV
ncbi:MAG: hypothetical protein H9893_03730 [Candidatus Niameybacter stercoravium]|nr:hypothetical protein [Candidatus Niameybacter stercoravium]